MNFLAHLWLADQTSTSLAGAVLGDWLHGRIPEDYPAELKLGVALHRRVDSMTDSHPAIAHVREQFLPGQRRFAGILLDVVTDHLLVRQWDRFSDESLHDFTQRCAREVASHGEWFEHAGGTSPDARDFQRLLLSYGSSEGIEHALKRTAQRLSKPEGLLAATAHWPAHARTLEPRLPELLNDLSAAAMAFVRDAQTTAADL
jgi:acyl carrier protein phosphodiesterase